MKYKPELTAQEVADNINWDTDPVSRSIDVGPGWYRLIWDLSEDLNRMHCNYVAVQVKEKFGGLRFYVAVTHADGCPALDKCPIDLRIRAAEARSYQTCQICGRDGSPDPRHSYGPTLCEGCRDDRLKSLRR